jgi:NADPH:quinone reductase-like Zn-dependent oxidoreductase
VGAYAVQLASHAGATVIATASGDDEAYLNSIGASRVIDYREAQFEKVLREKVDVVFDLVGGDTQKRSFLVLKEGGHLVSATQPVSQEETARHRVSGVMMRLAPSGTCSAESRDCWKRGRYDRTSRPCTRSGCGPGLEGHRREPARGSWDVAQWAGSGKTQVTRQDRASCGLA